MQLRDQDLGDLRHGELLSGQVTERRRQAVDVDIVDPNRQDVRMYALPRSLTARAVALRRSAVIHVRLAYSFEISITTGARLPLAQPRPGTAPSYRPFGQNLYK